MTGSGGGKTRIAILGGGIAALTAAFELTEQDPKKSRYDITLYTLGWRLGGKASVGRDIKKHGRAVEHGIHIWAGYYDNAFDIVKRLYARLNMKDPDAWKKCFEPLNHFTAMEYVEGEWKPWLLEFPQNDLEPGLGALPALTPLPLLVQFLSALEEGFDRSDLSAYVTARSRLEAQAMIAEIREARPLRQDENPLTLAREFAEQFSSRPPLDASVKTQALISILAASRLQVDAALQAAPKTDAMRRLYIFYDLAFTLASGLLKDNVLFRGFDAIDDREWSEWMSDNGCKPDSLNSGVVRGCYDYAFAGGDSRKPGIGAGTASLLFLRLLLTYKGSIMYALSQPMGDSIIAPLYQLLAKWGVKFEFFCRVKQLCLSPNEPVVERIVLAQQVRLAKGVSHYEPLIERADGAASWPLHPDPAQIENGAALRGYDLESAWTDWPDAIPERILRRHSAGTQTDGEKDVFNLVVLAMGFGGLETICGEFATRFPDTWGKCFQTMATTRTLALQLWLRPQTDDLGWPDMQTALTGFERPDDDWSDAALSTWEDNTRLLQWEAPRDLPVRSLAYFVNTAPDEDDIPEPGPNPAYPRQQHHKAKTDILAWMNRRLGILWPKFDWESLEAPGDVAGSNRLNSQFWKPNINPWDRYVLSAPGSVKHRIWPDNTGIDNLFLAGDWVRSGVNAGCLEAAVIAGRMAARAITEGDMDIPGDGNSGNFSLPVGALPVIGALDKLKAAAAGGVGTVEAYCITIRVTTDFAQSKLPPGLRLVAPTGWPSGHPLVLLFCRQRNVRPGFLPVGGLSYHEFVELIPCVERTDVNAPKGGPFSYMPYLLLDNLIPVIVGTNFYGFNKRQTRIAAQGGDFDIDGDLGEIQANFTRTGLSGSIGKFPEIEEGRGFLDLPLISKLATGAWVYSYLDYRLDTATFQMVDGEIAIGPPFVEDAQLLDASDSTDVPWFRFSAQWRISVPLSSGQVSDTEAPKQLRSLASQLRRARFGQF
jgi:uncharacterized protein with NAD-binding domain and iron-sulfur cluster